MLDKPAVTKYPLHDLLRRRWSSRAFASRPIEAEKIGSLVEAVRWSASAKNEQPWRLIIIEAASAQHQAAVSCLAESNLPWAAKAPLFILVFAATNFPDGSPTACASYDCGSAVCSLSLQAMAMDLFIHQLGAFNKDKARAAFNLPADLQPLTLVAIGYEGDRNELAEPRRSQETAPRQRKPLNEIACRNTWNHPANL